MHKNVYARISAAVILVAALAIPAFAWQPNDALYYRQWGLQAIGMEDAWEYNFGGSPDITVAVVDSGVDYNIPDFANTRFDMENAWDFVDGDSEPYDENGHGTHVAATIGQSTNNLVGAAGIAFNTTILPIRVLDDTGTGEYADIAAGIIHAVDAGADVINLSLGAQIGTVDLYFACEYAYENGVFITAAAGNDYGERYVPDFPAWYDSTLTVGAVDQDLHRAYFSQLAYDYGGYGLTAPGVSICQEIYDPALTDPAFVYYDGTSMAAPHVAGVAALLLAEAQELGLGQGIEGRDKVDLLGNLLKLTAQDLGPAGPDDEYGWGMVRADWALMYLNDLAASGMSMSDIPDAELYFQRDYSKNGRLFID